MFFVEVGKGLGLESGEDGLGFGRAAAAGEPAWGFGKMATEPPGEERAGTADEDDPAPSGHEEMSGDENAREQRGYRYGGESDDLRDGYVAAAGVTGDDFADVGVDNDDFGSDACAGEEAEGDKPRGGWSEGAGERKDGIEKQERHEDDAAAETVAAHAENDGADKHAKEARGDELGKLLEREEVGLLQSGADVGDDEDVVEVEEIAERDERDEAAVEAAEGETLDAGGDGGGVSHCGMSGAS